MRQAARALIIRDGKILVMHRNKFGHAYYILLGGGVDPGETPEQTLAREVYEESGFTIRNPRLVFVQDVGQPYGVQYIFTCETDGQEPVLGADTDEHHINQLGQNLYRPLWLPLDQLASVTFRTPELQQAILLAVQHGFPSQPVQLDAEYLDNLQASMRKG